LTQKSEPGEQGKISFAAGYAISTAVNSVQNGILAEKAKQLGVKIPQPVYVGSGGA
jgi:hypothetical protein